jgi:hypothetical protein
MKRLRCPNGAIDNCAMANGEPYDTCQMCLGACPDRARFNAGWQPRAMTAEEMRRPSETTDIAASSELLDRQCLCGGFQRAQLLERVATAAKRAREHTAIVGVYERNMAALDAALANLVAYDGRKTS